MDEQGREPPVQVDPFWGRVRVSDCGGLLAQRVELPATPHAYHLVCTPCASELYVLCPLDLQPGGGDCLFPESGQEDRKSTRLNSSHSQISYAVFCLKKKK